MNYDIAKEPIFIGSAVNEVLSTTPPLPPLKRLANTEIPQEQTLPL